MSTWNTPIWGSQTPGSVAITPAFPELYIRNYIDDLGILPSEATPLQTVVDSFIILVGQHVLDLSQLPSQEFSPIVYRNSITQYPTVDYIINSQLITYPVGILQTGDLLAVFYTH